MTVTPLTVTGAATPLREHQVVGVERGLDHPAGNAYVRVADNVAVKSGRRLRRSGLMPTSTSFGTILLIMPARANLARFVICASVRGLNTSRLYGVMTCLPFTTLKTKPPMRPVHSPKFSCCLLAVPLLLPCCLLAGFLLKPC